MSISSSGPSAIRLFGKTASNFSQADDPDMVELEWASSKY
jgi:hypothetical protein